MGHQAGVSWLYTKYDRVFGLLTHEGPEPFKPMGGEGAPKPKCMSYLLEICENIKKNPTRLIRLLIRLVKANLDFLDRRECDSELVMDLRDIANLTKRHCLGDIGSPPIIYMHELANLLIGYRDEAMRQWKYMEGDKKNSMSQLGDKEVLKAECNEVICLLRAPRRTTFGSRASQSLSCTVPLVQADIRTGWIGMGVYDGERPKPKVVEIEKARSFMSWPSLDYYL
jgi:hypothetical protein